MSEARGGRGGVRSLLFWILGASGALLLLRGGATLYVEARWFSAVGYLDLWVTRILREGAIRTGFAGAVALVSLAALRPAIGTLQTLRIRRRFGNLEIAEQIPRTLLMAGLTGISLLTALWFGMGLPGPFVDQVVLALHSVPWGRSEPFLGQDLGVYLFHLPVWSGVLGSTLLLVLLLILLATGIHLLTGGIRIDRSGIRLAREVAPHLGGLFVLLLLLLAGRFFLLRSLVLLDGSSRVQGIFGFADSVARQPALAAAALLTVGAAVWTALRIRAGKAGRGALGAAVLVLVGIGLVSVVPMAVQRILVVPNELARETPFIEANLEFTRIGFGIDSVIRAPLVPAAGAVPLPELLRGFPLWSRETLRMSFNQVETGFRYYTFPEVHFDRFPSGSGGSLAPVAVGVREVDPSRLPERSWQNLHLRERFIQGNGAVLVSASVPTGEGRPVPAPEAPSLDRPEVRFGTIPLPWAILPPDTLPVPGSWVTLRGGLETFLLALHLEDWNLLLTSEIGSGSRFLWRREVRERVAAIAPFLRFPVDPQPVLAGGRIHWVLDGFTDSPWFPLAARREFEPRRPIRYLRHGVKVVVDAVTGETRFYRLPVHDPLLEAWAQAYPRLFLPASSLPAEIAAHLRFPRELLDFQAGVLERYHVQDAPRFHSGEALWARPSELGAGGQLTPVAPEYALWTRPDGTDPEFLLGTVRVPVGRETLAALIVARNDPDGYGRLHLYEAPEGDRVPGPRQIEALVEQDPLISEQLSLWRQGGSEVWTGHLHPVPVPGGLLWIEGLFLAAESDAIPELRRVILSDGRRVAMEPSLDAALARLGDPSGAAAGTPDPSGADAAVVGSGAGPGAAPGADLPPVWPAEALRLLDAAERSLRAGDWAGYGAAIEALRSYLASLPPPSRGGS